MDYRLSDEQKSFVTAFADFVAKEIVPRGAAVESAKVFPMENYKRLAAFGYNGILHEERFGGTDLDHVTATLAQVELARGCASTYLSVGGLRWSLRYPSAVVCFGGDEDRDHSWSCLG